MSTNDDLPEDDKLEAVLEACRKLTAALKQENLEEAAVLQMMQSLNSDLALSDERLSSVGNRLASAVNRLDEAERLIEQMKSDLSAAEKREAALKQSNREEASALQEVQSLRERLNSAEAQIGALTRDRKAHGEAELKRGYLIACCNIENLHGETDIAADVLIECPISQADVDAMDLSDYDAEALVKIRASCAEDPIAPAPARTHAQTPEEIDPYYPFHHGQKVRLIEKPDFVGTVTKPSEYAGGVYVKFTSGIDACYAVTKADLEAVPASEEAA